MARQVALITGSSRGIGLSAAIELAREGFDVAVNSRRDSVELSKAADLVMKAGVSSHKVPFDVSETNIHEKVLDEVERALGPITTLVNNAGVGVSQRGDLLEVTEQSYDRCADVNAKAMFFLTQAFAKRVVPRARDQSLLYSIVNVTSANATAVAGARGEYCASKSAAAMISKIFAVRLGKEEIPVFEVRPGLIDTEMTKTVIETYQKRAAEGLCLFPRVGKPEEIGKVIASLATGRVPYATGQVISVDGGMLVPRF